MLYGPNPVQKTGTVTSPRELLREVGVEPGDRVHWILNPDLPGTLTLIPAATVARSMPAIVEGLRRSAR